MFFSNMDIEHKISIVGFIVFSIYLSQVKTSYLGNKREQKGAQTLPFYAL